tara:strand:- start:319 stop:492 length:174 start_codon:yes stop_codon:yes gene_type:complete
MTSLSKEGLEFREASRRCNCLAKPFGFRGADLQKKLFWRVKGVNELEKSCNKVAWLG